MHRRRIISTKFFITWRTGNGIIVGPVVEIVELIIEIAWSVIEIAGRTIV